MRRFVPPKLECEQGGDLIIRKDQPSPLDGSNVLMIGLGLLCLFAVVSIPIVVPITSPKAVVGLTWKLAVPSAVAIVLILSLTPAAIRATSRRAVLGRWRIGDGRVEFLGANGDRHFLKVDQITLVGWYPETVRLVGRDARIDLRPEGIPPAEWQQVRDRVQAILSPRFDLAAEPQTGSTEFKVSRVLAATLPACLLAVILLFGPTQLPEPWSGEG